MKIENLLGKCEICGMFEEVTEMVSHKAFKEICPNCTENIKDFAGIDIVDAVDELIEDGLFEDVYVDLYEGLPELQGEGFEDTEEIEDTRSAETDYSTLFAMIPSIFEAK